MTRRDNPTPDAFPVDVCEALLPGNLDAESIRFSDDSILPVPKLIGKGRLSPKNIVVIGTWAHQTSKLRLVKRGVDFYLEFKTPTAITTEPVTTKNEVHFFNPSSKDTWLIDVDNFIQSRLKNKNLGRNDKRLVIWERIKQW